MLNRHQLIATFWEEFNRGQYENAAHILNIIGMYDEVRIEELTEETN